MADIKQYTTRTGNSIDNAFNGMKQTLVPGSERIAGTIENIKNTAHEALASFKLVLAETGVWKQISTTGGVTRTFTKESSTRKGEQEGDKETFSHSDIKRDDVKKDSYLSLGDYLMPLSFDITVSGGKDIANSQLVDGINIIERIANQPKHITIGFRLESKPTGSYSASSAATIEDKNIILDTRLSEYGNSLTVIDSTTKYAADLSKMFEEIVQSDTVFEVVNPILNNDFNVTNVLLLSYSVTPMQGSSMWRIYLSLEEVNITQSLLYVTNSDGKQAQIPEEAQNYG